MPAVAIETIIEAVQRDDGTGFCLECGHEHAGVEPDARRYQCEECGAAAVYGAEECLIA